MANEKRLIDANALLEKADWYKEYNDITGEEIAFKYVFASDVEDAPTVDAVEVVRCKDCKWWQRKGLCPTPNYNGESFCSYGERREGE